jgi:hypothetical protein
MIETKIKEVNPEEIFPALYSDENRASIILVKKKSGQNKLEGVAVYPKNVFGEYSMNWSESKYKRMGRGSELTVKFLQE